MTMIRIRKMTMVISLMYLLQMMKETIRSDTNSLSLYLLRVRFFLLQNILKTKRRNLAFLLIISFVLILIRIFDRHALFHAYVSMKESFFLFTWKKIVSMFTNIRENLSTRKIWVWVIRENRSTPKFYLPEVSVTIAYVMSPPSLLLYMMFVKTVS